MDSCEISSDQSPSLGPRLCFTPAGKERTGAGEDFVLFLRKFEFHFHLVIRTVKCPENRSLASLLLILDSILVD
jgi:hypothetical protein